MSARPQEWPILDIAAELRRQLDEADARNAKLAAANGELERQVDDMQRVLLVTAEDLHREGRASTRGDTFWCQVAYIANERCAKVHRRLATVEQWLRESGAEAMRLQTERDIARHEHGVAASMLDATQERVNDLEGEIGRLRERLSESVGGRDVD